MWKVPWSMKPIRVGFLFRRRKSLFSEERGIGCKLLNQLGDGLPNSLQAVESGQVFRYSLLFSLFSGNSGLPADPGSAARCGAAGGGHLRFNETSSILGSSAPCADRTPSSVGATEERVHPPPLVSASSFRK